MLTLTSLHHAGFFLATVAAVGAQSVTAPPAWADDGPSPMQTRDGPPPEAFTACQGHSAGEACTVSLGGREIHGTCVAGSSDGLLCRPAGPPPGGPPPEAFAACQGRTAGDACTVALPIGGSVAGTCVAGPEDRLVCRPDQMPPRP